MVLSNLEAHLSNDYFCKRINKGDYRVKQVQFTSLIYCAVVSNKVLIKCRALILILVSLVALFKKTCLEWFNG